MERGNRVGNGTVSVAVGPGHYFAYGFFEDAKTTTAPSYVHATSGTESVHYRCATAIQARIQSLGLSGIDPANVIVRKLSSDRGADDGTYSYPMVVVSTLGIDRSEYGTNKRDTVGYPVMVAILAADNQDLETNHDKYLLWRQKIRRAFINQALSAVPEIWIVEIEPGPIVNPVAFWDGNLYHSSLILRCYSREERITA